MSAPRLGAVRRVVVDVAAEHPPEPAVTALPGTSDVAVALNPDAVLDAGAVSALLGQVSAALHPSTSALPESAQTEVRLPIGVSGRGAVVLQAQMTGASVRVQLGGVAVVVPARQAILVFSQMAALAIRAGTHSFAPLLPPTLAPSASTTAGPGAR